MGDRIAVLREGGILAQYATPDELLTSPADDFVARFVGTDRSLKRLSLSTVGELQLLDANGYDRNGRPELGPDTTLRDALAIILSHGGQPLPVVDADGRVRGLVSTDLISGVLTV
jgi:osmoprotectant transport system ATP-binding protein